MTAAKTFGELLQARRLELNKTQEDIGRIVGVGGSAISNYETDRVAPPKERLGALLVAYQLTREALQGFGVNIADLRHLPHGPTLTADPLLTRETGAAIERNELKIYTLKAPTIFGHIAPGADSGFSAILIADADLGTVNTAWGASVIETAAGFAVRLIDALEHLQAANPEWIIIRGAAVDVIPNLY